MKEAKRCYTHYGHMCRRCGAYAVYTDGDLAEAQFNGDVMDDEVSVKLRCPYCDSPFIHNLDREDIDIEPDGSALAALDHGAAECTPVLIAPLNVGDNAYLAYDEYYAKGGSSHHWVATPEPNVVKSLSYKADADGAEVEYKFENIVFEANDPRQHCRETFHSCIAFPTFEEAAHCAAEHNGEDGKFIKC